MALISSALCLGLKALESKGVFRTSMEKIWLLAKGRETFQLLRINTGPQKMRGKRHRAVAPGLGARWIYSFRGPKPD